MALSLQSGLSLGLIHNGGQFTIQGSHKDLCASPLEYHGTEAKGTMLQCLFTPPSLGGSYSLSVQSRPLPKVSTFFK